MRYRQTFEVTAGAFTRFPLDMLRYDRAFPSSPEDADKIKLLSDMWMAGKFYDQEPDTKHVVTVVRQCEAKTQTPTIGRWQSFGWEVSILSTEKTPVRNWREVIKATGEGDFPVDLLQVEGWAPHQGEDVSALEGDGKRTVKLVRWVPKGLNRKHAEPWDENWTLSPMENRKY